MGGCECTMSYKGTLKEGGATFDQAKKFKFCLGAGEVIKGWEVIRREGFWTPTVVSVEIQSLWEGGGLYQMIWLKVQLCPTISFQVGVRGMKVGGQRKLTVPAKV